MNSTFGTPEPRTTREKLFVWSRHGETEDLKRLISDNKDDPGFDINVVDRYGRTALHHAASKEVVELLLDNGIDINHTSRANEHALHELLDEWDGKRLPEEGVISLFRKRGARMDLEEWSRGETPLHRACWAGSLHCVQELLDPEFNDVNVNAITDHKERTPLHMLFASYKATDDGRRVHGLPEIMRLLLDRGADVTILDGVGYTPLQYVPLMGAFYPGIVSALVEKGAIVNHSQYETDSPLHGAIGHEELDKKRGVSKVADLLDNGANPYTIADDTVSPIQYAFNDGKLDDFFRICLEKGNYKRLFDARMRKIAKEAVACFPPASVTQPRDDEQWQELQGLERIAKAWKRRLDEQAAKNKQEIEELEKKIAELRLPAPIATAQVHPPEPMGDKRHRS